jgi:zinc protease
MSLHSPDHGPAMSGPLAPAARLAPVRTVLANGAVVTAKETRKTPAVTMNVAMRAGSLCDPDDGPGATFLLSKLLDRGTARRSADDIAEALERRGASLSFSVNRHVLSVLCTCLSADFDVVLDIIGDVLIEPSIPAGELAPRKSEVITAIAQDEDSPYVTALQRLMAMMYGERHPYGRSLKGSAESIDRLTREHLLGLHRARFAPSELSVVVVGDLAPARAVDAASRVFGGWTVPRPAPVVLAHPVAATARRRLVVPMMNKSQADVAYGFTTIERSDPAYYACLLMNNVLGQYALGGRLGDSIRERQGMAYYVSSAFEANLVEGPLMIRAGVAPGNVDRAVASIDEELTRMRTEGVTETELTESRQYLVGSMPRSLETNAGIAHFLQNAEFFGLGLDYDARLSDLLGAVRLDDVHAAARRLLDPERATIVVAGPYVDAA